MDKIHVNWLDMWKQILVGAIKLELGGGGPTCTKETLIFKKVKVH